MIFFRLVLFIFFYCLPNFVQLYLREILCTRNVYFRICTSNLRISRRSLNYSFLWDIPLSAIRYTLAVFIQAYGYDLCMLLLLWFLFPCIHRAFVTSSLCLLWSFRRLLVSYIWVQILYGTCNSIAYVLNYLCQVSRLDPPLVFNFVGWQTDFIIHQGRYFFYA